MAGIPGELPEDLSIVDISNDYFSKYHKTDTRHNGNRMNPFIQKKDGLR